jgi:hypothetical protein
MRYCSFLRSQVLFIVAALSACSAFPSAQTPGMVSFTAGLNTPSLSNPSTPTTSTPIEESQPLTTPTPVEPTSQILYDSTMEPGSILYRTPTSTPTPTSPTATVVPGKVERVNSGRFVGWYKYTQPKYGFSFYIPPDWTITDEFANHVGVSPVWQPAVELNIGFKNVRESGVVIMRTGVGAGDIVLRGTVRFLGQTLSRDVLVYEGKDKTVLYNQATEIQIDDLVFTLSLDGFNPNLNYGLVALPADIQLTADKIVESFELGDP